MTPETYTPPEARPEGFESTAETAERMAAEAGTFEIPEEPPTNPEEIEKLASQLADMAFEAIAQDEKYQKTLENVKGTDTFEDNLRAQVKQAFMGQLKTGVVKPRDINYSRIAEKVMDSYMASN